MTIRVALHHTTRYGYDRPVSLSPQVVRLRPAPHCRTPIEAYSLRILPKAHFLNWQQDPFGNYQARLVFPEPAAELSVQVDLIADMTVINPFDFFLDEYAEHFPFDYPTPLRRDLAPYLARTSHGDRFTDLAELARTKDAVAGRRSIDVLVDLNRRVQQKLHYDIRMEPGVFEPEETLERGHGSCRDFAWLLVQLLRNLGLAARFVSGYSIQLKADEKPVVGPAGVESDATDLHAWAEVFLPGAGWVGLDATSGLLAGEGHIPLACTPDPSGAAPVTGSFDWHKRNENDKVAETFSFAMKVTRVREEPRVTLPYSEDTWQAIDSLGKSVDAALEAGDVRLTMGGEPTFVAADDPESAEWNTAALGPTKRKYASELLQRLYPRFTPGALRHEGLGKWYPGEPLPRWALSCYFRKDGLPVWRDPALFATDDKGQDTEQDAQTFVAALATTLGVEARLAHPAYEDTWYYLWRERRLPVNVDPFDAKLDDELERTRLARVFEQGLAKIVGYALPLRRIAGPNGPVWTSGKWVVRPERLYLSPGDSPMGLRLPLEGLPWVDKADYPHLYERDPFAPTDPLPARFDLGRRPATIERQSPHAPRVSPVADPGAASILSEGAPTAPTSGVPRRAGSEATAGGEATPGGEATAGGAATPASARADGPPRRLESDRSVIRTALCVEPRDGILHVFMPPTETAEDYLDLCAAIENTAAAQGTRVRIEGYHPPTDSRLSRLQITPDPGVIEVNTVPSGGWKELVESTTFLYEEARQVGLRSEKFMIDGRHVGAGGGNHVVLGGPSPADSPVLRRPDLLRSMLAYWLNHPSLSFLFSGLFVGPTSQAPRVDEARHDSLYELDIAFRTLEAQSAGHVPLWLVDRIFRNLLVDATGNTHRTEFCIDKLYSPDTAAGRQGLVELRAFEMPPHPRMSLTQQLLVRALVATFWKTPYRESPVRWGTELHDRFSLPHFVREDFEDVLDHLARAGFRFEPAWFDPHREFRFPLLGSIAARSGLVLELRQAIEPWHVLGEEAGGGGNVRYVDSSVERVEVKVRGMTDDRHIVAVNGRRIPLHPTGTSGEFVAGVRYRAWQPPSALHPTIGVHAPLVFDLFDRWNDRAVAGCTYHVAHPGGRSHENFPRNGFEAEGRRVARFMPFGHTPGKELPPPLVTSRQFPFTLDLRS